MGIFEKVKSGLSKTRNNINSIVKPHKEVDEEFYESLEEALITADVGTELSTGYVEELREDVSNFNIKSVSEAYRHLKEIIINDLKVESAEEEFPPKPWVELVVGVNGVGKTTTIGKLASIYKSEGRSVVLGASDTFRAGAIEQLKIWGQRTGTEVVSQKPGSDPASVAFDTLRMASARDKDTILLDTAGRLHNKVNLMKELNKIVRVLQKEVPHAPNETTIILDATTGQNSIKQIEEFKKSINITNAIITKLDGTAKGGIAVSVARRYKLPISKIGVGEKVEDLQSFDPAEFVEAMLGDLS